MTVLFYLFTILALYYEMCQVIDTRAMLDVRSRLIAFDKTSSTQDAGVLLYAVFMMMYCLWAGIGLFSSQWPLFLMIFLLSFIPKGRSIGLSRIDGVMTAIVLVLIILNKFHFKYDFSLIWR
jgi:hypothetical protein